MADQPSSGLEARLLVVEPDPGSGLLQKLEASGVPADRIVLAESYSEATVLGEAFGELIAGAVVQVNEPKGQRTLPSMTVRETVAEHDDLRQLLTTLRSTRTAAYSVAVGNSDLDDLYAIGVLDPDASGVVPESYVPRLGRRFADLLLGTTPGTTARYSLRLVRDKETRYERPLLCSQPSRAASIIYDILKDYEGEAFGALLLDSRNRAIGHTIPYLGTVNKCIAEPRGIFAPALLSNAPALILFHNHPSGDPSPSREDIQRTKTMIEAGDALGVRVLDHIIVGEDGGYASLRERGLM